MAVHLWHLIFLRQCCAHNVLHVFNFFLFLYCCSSWSLLRKCICVRFYLYAWCELWAWNPHAVCTKYHAHRWNFVWNYPTLPSGSAFGHVCKVWMFVPQFLAQLLKKSLIWVMTLCTHSVTGMTISFQTLLTSMFLALWKFPTIPGIVGWCWELLAVACSLHEWESRSLSL